jgi:hypothetical protein
MNVLPQARKRNPSLLTHRKAREGKVLGIISGSPTKAFEDKNGEVFKKTGF